MYTEEPNYYLGCRELRDREEIEFEGKKNEPQRFYFKLDKPWMFDVHAWPTAENSGPDLYIGHPKIKETDEECSTEVDSFCNTWLSHYTGPNHIMVQADDEKM